MIAGELFTSLLAMYTADTGSGGLNATASAAYVRNFDRVQDTNSRSDNWPLVEVEIVEQEGDPFERNKVQAIVKFHIFTKALTRFADQNAVIARMRTVFHKTTPGNGSAWTFGQMGFRSGVQAPQDATKDELRYIITARVEGRSV